MIQQFDIWLADLSPSHGTEPGKTRPVLIIQSNLLNSANHRSTVICPFTTDLVLEAQITRVLVSAKKSGLLKTSNILIDQIRSIDNNRFVKKIGSLPNSIIPIVKQKYY